MTGGPKLADPKAVRFGRTDPVFLRVGQPDFAVNSRISPTSHSQALAEAALSVPSRPAVLPSAEFVSAFNFARLGRIEPTLPARTNNQF